MRQITREAINAFQAGRNWSKDNTRVVCERMPEGYKVSLFLFGNEIAKSFRTAPNDSGTLFVTLAGYPTPTTRERLNGLSGVSVGQKGGKQYLNGKEISSREWYEIK